MWGTRTQKQATRDAAAQSGHDATDILEGRRPSYPPDKYGSAAHAAPSNKRKKNGRFPDRLNPGHDVIRTVWIPFSGDSMADIKKLVRETGQGGPGSGQTWHHGNFDPITGKGPCYLMDTATHAAIPHTQGSAQARAAQPDSDPARSANLGYPAHPYG